VTAPAAISVKAARSHQTSATPVKGSEPAVNAVLTGGPPFTATRGVWVFVACAPRRPVSRGDDLAFGAAAGVFAALGVAVVAAAGELVFVFVLALESVREPAVVCAVVPPEPPPSWTTPVEPLVAFPPPVPVPTGPPADVPSTVT